MGWAAVQASPCIRASVRSRRWLWVVALLATACLTLPAGAEGIVGGYIPSTSEWPWVARINTPTSLCTGTLIAPQRVLTAAHCVEEGDALRPASDFTVAVNRRNASILGEVRHVTTVVAHPGYVPGEGD